VNDELFFTFLVCYGARCFACGLAGSLALSATALFNTFLKICFVDYFDVFHKIALSKS
jgi:hypothetical protein